MNKVLFCLFAILIASASLFSQDTTAETTKKVETKIDNPIVVGDAIMLGVNGSEFLLKDFHTTSKKRILLKYNDGEIFALYDMDKKITKIQLANGFIIVKTKEELKELGLYEFIYEEMKLVKRF